MSTLAAIDVGTYLQWSVWIIGLMLGTAGAGAFIRKANYAPLISLQEQTVAGLKEAIELEERKKAALDDELKIVKQQRDALQSLYDACLKDGEEMKELLGKNQIEMARMQKALAEYRVATRAPRKPRPTP